MEDGEFGKYFIPLGIDFPMPDGKPFVMGPILERMDDKKVKGSNFYFLHWVLPHDKPHMKIGHPPHIHKEAELLIHIGTNPDDPGDLGAEVELCMGPKLERHIITRSTIVFIPPNCIHAPWNPLRTWRPWIFIEINQSLTHTEKFFPNLLSPEIRDQLDWKFWHDEGF
jgi:hypothetical protein